jgi:hypothetical protein
MQTTHVATVVGADHNTDLECTNPITHPYQAMCR